MSSPDSRTRPLHEIYQHFVKGLFISEMHVVVPLLFTLKPNVEIYIYRVPRGECARLRENVPYVKVHRYNPKHLYPKLNGYGDNGERILKV